jgi:hypothetical protein
MTQENDVNGVKIKLTRTFVYQVFAHLWAEYPDM